jgi:cation:H+ antiporter
MIFVMAVIGLVILVIAGDALVRGAVSLSLRLGIPALIVSLTVVAFGTSAPELLVSVQAMLDGSPQIALGNVVGSNIANVLLVMGLPALVAGFARNAGDMRKSWWLMLGASLLLIGLGFRGTLGLLAGTIFLAGIFYLVVDSLRDALRGRAASAPSDVEMRGPALTAILLVGGLVGLPVGARLFVDNAIEIARLFHVSESVIGLTLVAVGTSLPELATSVVAAIRGRGDVAFANVIGSNIFNIFGILGVASLLGPIPVGEDFLRRDLWVMLAAALALVPFVFLGWRFGRRWGAVFVAGYGVYLMALIA